MDSAEVVVALAMAFGALVLQLQTYTIAPVNSISRVHSKRDKMGKRAA